MPYTYKMAIKDSTRTMEGIPGPHYFQNGSDYSIEVRFDPKSGKLKGKADITYFNNSRDTLRKIVIRLYQNIGKKGGIRDEPYNAEDIHKGVAITALRVNKTDLLEQPPFRTKLEGTNLTAFLTDPLSPYDSCKIEIKWYFSMPLFHVHRFGQYGEGSYFVAYWYPQIAVYDDIDGWDMMNYTGTHEFYNDFSNFDVRISVPKGFMVWATGNWKNSDGILNKQLLQRLEKAYTSDEVVQIIRKDDWERGRVLWRKGSQTFHFRMERISDFAFAVSNNYLWDATSVVVDSSSQRRVRISSVYNSGSTNFKNVASIGRQVIQHFSFNSYGIPFPFPGITIFNGEGGMEYPMMVNNGDMFLRNGTVFLTMHEIAHSYFPFLAGINERKHSWLDEGLTTYLPMETEEALHSSYYPIELIVRRYNALAGTETDVPFYLPSYQTRENTYQFYSYIRSSMAFNMLEEYIGR